MKHPKLSYMSGGVERTGVDPAVVGNVIDQEFGLNPNGRYPEGVRAVNPYGSSKAESVSRCNWIPRQVMSLSEIRVLE